MHSNKVRALFWAADGLEFPPGYADLIVRFFGDVAADSGQPSNVYGVTPEYGDAAGPAAYDSTYAARIDDAMPYPAGTCVSPDRPRCLDDNQLEAELDRVIAAHGLPIGVGELYAVFTPPGMSVCRSRGVCSDNAFCGFHYALAAGTPYMFVAPPENGRCGSSAQPNGNVADEALSVVSHEHIEAITDPLGNAWGDAAGQEVADKCERSFGQPLGNTTTGAYNQLINGRPYWLQGEWSNAAGECVHHAPVAPPTAVIAAPAVVAKGQSSVLDAHGSDGLGIRSDWDLPDGTTASGPEVQYRFGKDGAAPITLRVTDAVGQTATAQVTVDVRKTSPRVSVRARRVGAMRWRFSAA
ncbi:MAG: hypothetical protein QOI64_2419, partial [Solirubrobacteraceae bacterium]|nr:hypothetical protein [Solirubrobacteraceae bacterium]